MPGESSVDGHMPVTKHLPKTLDGSREIVVLTLALGAIASFTLFTIIDSQFWAIVANGLLWCAVFFLGSLGLRFLRARTIRKAALDAEEFKSMMEKETARKLAEAKASGAFNRFSADSDRER